ncbi:MAG: protoporphyrinogen oxidase [Acidimicrobiales bacterium]|nr:protoporphyrinogen oxidase [Acidimicrobiales bacterium]
MAKPRIAIVGGGIAGLAAAHHLVGEDVEVHLFEAADRLGGKIDSTMLGAEQLPAAADNFLARVPQMKDLAHELGLGDELISPTATNAYIYRDGSLHPLPPTLLGIPADLDVLAESSLISNAGVERARADLSAPDDRPEGDESVGDLVRRRLGDEVHEYLVDPLLGGINAGDSDRLSITYGVPQIRAARDRDASLIRAAQNMRSGLIVGAPVFLSLRGGLQVLIDALADELEQDEWATVHIDSPVADLQRGESGWQIEGASFDAVIVAVPPVPASALLSSCAPAAAAAFGAIEMSSVVMTVIALAPESLPVASNVSGVLIPRLEGLHVTAVSIATNKWPDLSDRQILRVSVGRRTDTRWRSLDPDELTAIVISDLQTIFGCAIHPQDAIAVEWIDSLPQYDVDHGQRIDAVESTLAADCPGVHLAGASLRGLGLPACVQSGRDAADAALSSIR